MVDVMQYALEFMAVYGLLAVFILLVLDGAALLPAFPGEVVLIIAVHQYAHDLPGLALVFLVAVSAAMVGSFIVYGLGFAATGRKGKPRRKILGMSVRRQERMERVFARPIGQSLVLFLRLFPLTRVLVSIPAGLARMPVWRFFTLSLIGMTIFYGAFLWLTFKFRDSGSPVAATAANLQAAAYNSPGWTFIQANWIATGAIVVLIGVILSVRASRRMARDPEETSGSLIGTLATMVLFWGGVAVLVGLWLDPALVYEFLLIGGVDVFAHPLDVPYEPFSVVAGVAILAILLAWALHRIRRAARRKNKLRARKAAAAAALAVQEEEAPSAPTVFVPIDDDTDDLVTFERADEDRSETGQAPSR